MRKTLVLLVGVGALSGCARLGYYAHLGKGGLALAVRGENVEKLLLDPQVSPELKQRLSFAGSILEFADEELGLPVGKKYRRYLDLERPFVVWTVVAAPEFSLEPETWCFPVVGCVGYRGFFTPERADHFANRLRVKGLDVSIGGVPAFSSLGWLGDSLLNTFLFDEDRRLAGLIFHELAHGLLYAKDDSGFNESFASAVERAGVRRWLNTRASGGEEPANDYLHYLAQADRTYEVIERIRDRLEKLYTSAQPDRSAQKEELFNELENELRRLASPNGSSGDDDFAFSGWVDRDLNNADLASIGLYRKWLDSFEALLGAVDDDLPRFYSSARCLAGLDVEERSRRLETREWSECILDGRLRPARRAK